MTVVAALTGVPYGTVHNIKRGLIWKHVEPFSEEKLDEWFYNRDAA